MECAAGVGGDGDRIGGECLTLLLQDLGILVRQVPNTVADVP